MMKGCLKSFARKLTDCFATLAMTKPKVLISLGVGIIKGYLKAFTYGLCHCEARMPVSLNQSFGMMEGGLKVFARKLTDWFDESRIPSARNDKAEINFNSKVAYTKGKLGIIYFKNNLDSRTQTPSKEK
jgi:hypothetical protein